MARKRNQRRRTAVRSGATSKGSMRQLHRAVNDVIAVSVPPQDPPRIKLGRTYTTIIQFHLGVGTEQKSFNGLGDAIITKKVTDKGVMVYNFSMKELGSCLAQQMGFSDKLTLNHKVAIHKVAIWGPIGSQGLSSLCAHLDDGVRHQTATDTGTQSVRPRVGFTVPRTRWENAMSDLTVLTVEVVAVPGSSVLNSASMLCTVQVTASVMLDYGAR